MGKRIRRNDMRNYIIFTQKELDRMKDGEIVDLITQDGDTIYFMSDDTYEFMITPGVIEETNNSKEE